MFIFLNHDGFLVPIRTIDGLNTTQCLTRDVPPRVFYMVYTRPFAQFPVNVSIVVVYSASVHRNTTDPLIETRKWFQDA